MNLIEIAQNAKQASLQLATLGNKQKNQALLMIADRLQQRRDEILAINSQDIAYAREQGLSEAIIDRLLLTPERIQAIANDVRNVAKLADPVGQVIDGGVLESEPSTRAIGRNSNYL